MWQVNITELCQAENTQRAVGKSWGMLAQLQAAWGWKGMRQAQSKDCIDLAWESGPGTAPANAVFLDTDPETSLDDLLSLLRDTQELSASKSEQIKGLEYDSRRSNGQGKEKSQGYTEEQGTGRNTTKPALTCNPGWLLLRNGLFLQRKAVLLISVCLEKQAEERGHEALPTWAKSLELWNRSRTAQIISGDRSVGNSTSHQRLLLPA